MKSLLNEKVSHRKFGAGTIVEAGGKKIKVQFLQPGTPKLFGYPMAFEKFLVLDDQELQEECHTLAVQMRRELDLEEKERMAEIARIAEEKKKERIEAIKLKRRSSAKKPGTRAAATPAKRKRSS